MSTTTNSTAALGTAAGAERPPSRFRALTAPRTRVIRGWDAEDVDAWEAGNKTSPSAT